MSRKLIVELIGDDRKLRKSLDDSTKKTKRFGTSLASLGNVAKLGAVAGVGLAAVAVKGFVEKAKEAEAADMRLKQAFDNVKASAKQRAAAQEAVNKVSRQAGLDDEDLSDVLAKMARSTGSVEKATNGMALAANIARARNISLEQASKAVEKAYLGNFTALKKVGVAIDPVTKAQDNLRQTLSNLGDGIRMATGEDKKLLQAQYDALKATKESAKAEDARVTTVHALRKAQEQFAGSSERYGNTAAGAQAKFQVAVENLQESLGKKLLPVVTQVMVALTEVVTWTEQNWPRISATIEKTYNQQIKPPLDSLISLTKTVVQTIRDNWGTIGPIVEAAGKIIKNTVGIIVDALKIITALLKGDWGKAWDAFKDAVGRAIDNVKTLIGTELNLIKQVGAKLAEKFIDGVTDGLKALPGLAWDAIKALPALILNMDKTIIGWGISIGKGILGGIVDGLKGVGTAIKDAAGGFAKSVGNAIISVLNGILEKLDSALTFTIPIPFHKDYTVNAPIPRIPYLAAGGIVNRPTLAMIGEAGPEAVVPLNKMGGGNTFVFPNYVGDKDDLMRAVDQGVRDLERRGGRLGGTRIQPGFAT